MFKLKQYFLLVGGAAFILFTLVFLYASYNHDQDNLKSFGERENITLAGYLSNLLFDQIKHYTELELPQDKSQIANLDEVKNIEQFIAEFAKKYPILKVKIFNLDGLTIYSTVEKEIAVQKPMNAGLKSAATYGKPHSEMAFKKEITSLSGELFDREIVETYIPIRGADQKIIAVFELYSDVTVLVKESRSALNTFLFYLLLGYLALFLFLYEIIRRADNMIKSQYYQLNESNAQLETAKNTLEETVQERTNELSTTVMKLEKEVGERRQAELKLKKLSVAVEQNPTAVLISDINGNIEYVNPKFSQVTGWSYEEVIGLHTRILGSGETTEKTYKKLWETILKGEVWKGEINNKKKNGEMYIELTTISPIRDDNGKLSHFLANSEDITIRREHEKRIHHLAHHDTLTGLYNRFSLELRLEQAIAQTIRSGKQLAVLFMDLDRFKLINDSLGHKAGDELLIQVADKLKSICRRQSDIVARIGGDEFVVVLSEISSPTYVALTATTLVKVLSLPFDYEGTEMLTSPSIGISLYPSDGESIEDLLKNADTAMYHVKEAGRGDYQFYTREMNTLIEEKLILERDLREAISANTLELYYQPQIDTKSYNVSGVEALLRWNHPKFGFISPEKFIGIAEESHLIFDLGSWVINQAFKQVSLWRDKGINELKMAINISAKQLESNTFVESVRRALLDYKLQPEMIELEVTESTAMTNPEEAIEKLLKINELGIELAIDDFGTGHSSLAYLQKLPVQNLKLDRSFVMNIEEDENNAAICLASLSLAHSLGFKVVAEGVETAGQAKYLIDNKCDILQGYYFSRPKTARDLESFLLTDLPELGLNKAESDS